MRFRVSAGPLLALISCAAPRLALAQVGSVPAGWVGAPGEEYARVLQLTGVMPLSSLMIRPTETAVNFTPPDSAQWRAPWIAPWLSRRANDTARWEVGFVDPVTRGTYNSAFPYGVNDGAMWAGRGPSAAITAGVRARYGPVTLDVVPTYTWSANQSFDMAALYNPTAGDSLISPYADQFEWKFIDRPQRFGDRAVSRFDAGQSVLTVSWRGARAGVASRNMWWGPGVDNALIMTNNAAGFRHVFVGTRRPASIGIGKLEALYTVGRLEQSKFWRLLGDTFPTNRWLNGLTLVFEPKGLSGMYFGATRLFYAYERYNPITVRELLTIFQTFEKKALADSTNPEASDLRDQMLSLNFRWAFPAAGFEVYGEWGKNDHNWDRRDLILYPEHARGVLLGARKVVKLRDGLLSARFEATDITLTPTFVNRATPTWYTHTRIRQGYTQFGQVMGAGIGPGADQQVFALDWYVPRGRYGFVLQRIAGDKDAFYRVRIPDFFRGNVTLAGGPRVTLLVGSAQVDATYMLQYEFNRHTDIRRDVRNHILDLVLRFGLPSIR